MVGKRLTSSMRPRTYGHNVVTTIYIRETTAGLDGKRHARDETNILKEIVTWRTWWNVLSEY